jgi:2-amino-4-hydroxy-6-hydroxymethyldihydropteridine diphosphokinase
MFLNAVAEIETTLPAHDLMSTLLEVERLHGRVRGERNGPRTLDLDLLLYDRARISEPALELPHPRMWEREFVMRPLAELCDVVELRRIWCSST